MNTDRLSNALVATDLAEARGDISHLSDAQRDDLDRARLRLAEGDVTATHVVSTILDRQVRMPLYRWDDAQRAFTALARKAAARGLPVPTIEEVSRETVGEGDTAETWLTARILGAAPVLDGWRCVATLTETRDYKNGAPVDGTERVVLHTATGEEIVEAHDDMRCDHCGFARRRHLVFVLRHEDGRETQVGSTCLNEYLGTDALGAWFVWSRLHEISERLSGWCAWDPADHAQWLADHPEIVTRKDTAREVPLPLVDYLAACVAEIRCCGYVSRSLASSRRYETGEDLEVTGRKVWRAMQDATHVAPLDADFDRAREIVAWIETLDAYAVDYRTEEPTYTARLRMSLDASVRAGVHESDANMLASAVPAFAREIERRSSDAAWTDSWVPGEVGDAVVLDLTVRRSIGWALACADAEGRQVIVRKHEYKSGGNIEIGDSIRVSGSLGGLDTYRGVKQTFISRPSVYRVDETLSPALRKKAAAMFARLGQDVPEWAQAPAKRSRKK